MSDLVLLIPVAFMIVGVTLIAWPKKLSATARRCAALFDNDPGGWVWNEKRQAVPPVWVVHWTGIEVRIMDDHPLIINVKRNNGAFNYELAWHERRAIRKAFERWRRLHPFLDVADQMAAFQSAFDEAEQAQSMRVQQV